MIPLYEDIIQSRRAALQRDGWLYGERMNRIGDPFRWVDGDQIEHIGNFPAIVTALQYLTMSGEIYETPKAIRCADFDQAHDRIRAELISAIKWILPFDAARDFSVYIDSTASVKAQDYGAIRTWAAELPEAPNHLDIGPGLGANALYSLYGLGGRYSALEAHPVSYETQRQFLKAVSGPERLRLDLVDCESLGLSQERMQEELAANEKYALRQIPSWQYGLVPSQSLDLVSATWVLNEVTPAGITWLLHHSTRALKVGGYFYIRDSGLRKPLRHQLDYDAALIEMGFTQVARLDIENRIDMHGIPRIFQKNRDQNIRFEDVFERFFGRFAVTSHGGAYNQT
tara:strand:+ start:5123 stop:6148 length:1026 start_codon:yes stop_codon:yes gene_type:complete